MKKIKLVFNIALISILVLCCNQTETNKIKVPFKLKIVFPNNVDLQFLSIEYDNGLEHKFMYVQDSTHSVNIIDTLHRASFVPIELTYNNTVNPYSIKRNPKLEKLKDYRCSFGIQLPSDKADIEDSVVFKELSNDGNFLQIFFKSRNIIPFDSIEGVKEYQIQVPSDAKGLQTELEMQSVSFNKNIKEKEQRKIVHSLSASLNLYDSLSAIELEQYNTKYPHLYYTKHLKRKDTAYNPKK